MEEQNSNNHTESKEEQKPMPVSSVKPEDRNIALLSYLFLLVLVPLLTKRNNEFVMFHAKQGVVLAIAWFVIMIFGWIPIIGWLAFLFCLVLTVMGLMNVMNSKKQELPLIGKFASKFDF